MWKTGGEWMRRRRGRAVFGLTLVLGTACGEPAASTPDAARAGCVPGEARACPCASGGPGQQVCDGTGSAFSDCACVGVSPDGEVPQAPDAARPPLPDPDAAVPAVPDAERPPAPDAAPIQPMGEPFPFEAPALLGRPTDRAFTLNVLPAADGEVTVEVFGADGTPVARTTAVAVTAHAPAEVRVEGLSPDQSYPYAIRGRLPGETDWRPGAEGRVHTQRPPGRPFVFTIQADSHLDDKSDVELYHQSLRNAVDAAPDFHVDLGDTFMCEKHSEPFTGVRQSAPDLATVEARYRGERAHFGILGPTVPLFLVNGNHEGEQGWRRDGSNDTLPEWVTITRKRFYPNPEPDDFYTGPAMPDPAPEIGQRQAYYAWTWGDALFVVLDPFWYTTERTGGLWAWTLGDEQYHWLADTLDGSDARWKFVFAHHLVGGVNSSNRGGIEGAHLYEWGGLDADGTPRFDELRPGWEAPIHDLMVATGVTAFFHGHDHLYVQQVLDGIVYQEVPQPSAVNDRNTAQLAEEGGYVAGEIRSGSGILRVEVAADHVQVDFVRSRIGDTAADNGHIEHTYTLGVPEP